MTTIDTDTIRLDGLIVKPGETLVLRFAHLSMDVAGQIHKHIAAKYPHLAGRVLLVDAEQMAVMQPKDDT